MTTYCNVAVTLGSFGYAYKMKQEVKTVSNEKNMVFDDYKKQHEQLMKLEVYKSNIIETRLMFLEVFVLQLLLSFWISTTMYVLQFLALVVFKDAVFTPENE